MPAGTVSLEISEYQSLINEQEALKASVSQLRTHNAIETARLVDKRLLQIAGHAVPIVKFAMAHLSPEATHGWPREDLHALVGLLEDYPHTSISSSMDEASWVDDARAFVNECEDWDHRRELRQLRLPASDRGLAFMAHPVGRDPATRPANIARAHRWLRYLVETTPHSICAPWLPYVMSLDEDRHRQRGLDDNLMMLRHCDRMYLVGGSISSGMERERQFFMALGRPVISLLDLGEEPPPIADREAIPVAVG